MMITRENILKHKNWKPLGDVVEFLDHKRKPITESERVDGEFPYYGANGLQGMINDYIFDEPLILLAEDGGFFGLEGKSIAYTINGKSWVNNHAHVLKPKSGYNLDYIFRHLQFYDVSPFVNGTTRGKLTKGSAEQIPIFIPGDVTKQKQIANLIDKADSIRKKRQESIRLADEFLRSTFLDMFEDPVGNRNNFQTKSLSEICTKITDGTHDTPERLKKGIKFITGKHIRAFIIDFDNSDFVTNEVHEEIYRRCNPEYGDILYTNIGVNLGTAAMNTVNYEFSMKNVALLKPNQNIVTSRFVEHTLNYQNMKDSILRSASLGGAQQFMSLTVINNIKLPTPPIELQKKFSSIVEQAETIKRGNNISLTESENLFNSLMQRAFRGEL